MTLGDCSNGPGSIRGYVIPSVKRPWREPVALAPAGGVPTSGATFLRAERLSPSMIAYSGSPFTARTPDTLHSPARQPRVVRKMRRSPLSPSREKRASSNWPTLGLPRVASIIGYRWRRRSGPADHHQPGTGPSVPQRCPGWGAWAAAAAGGRKVQPRRLWLGGASNYRGQYAVVHREDGVELPVAIGTYSDVRAGSTGLSYVHRSGVGQRRGAGIY